MKYITKLFFIMLLLLITLPLAAQDDLQNNKSVVISYLDFAYNRMDLDGASTLLTENVVVHDPNWESHDIQGYTTNYQLMFERVREFNITPYAVIGEGDFVVVTYLWEGSKAPKEPRAANEPISGNAVEFFKVQDGKIVEIWRQTEQHDFSILGTSEDYRSMVTLPMTSDVAAAQATTTNAAHQVVLSWIDSYNNGKLDTSLMQSHFIYHTCPCSDIGTVDLNTFAENFRQMKEAGTLKQMTPISHNLGLMMVSEGDLTAVLFDTHADEIHPDVHADQISIFRLEAGKILDLWDF